MPIPRRDEALARFRLVRTRRRKLIRRRRVYSRKGVPGIDFGNTPAVHLEKRRDVALTIAACEHTLDDGGIPLAEPDARIPRPTHESTTLINCEFNDGSMAGIETDHGSSFSTR